MDFEKYMNDSNLEASSESEVSTSSNDNGDIETPTQETSEASTDATTNESPSLEDQLSSFDSAEKTAEESETPNILNELNDLGIIRHGLPVEFDDVDKVKEYLSKGYDYTQKTQELAEQRKEFDSFKAEQEQVFEQKMQEIESFKQQNMQSLNENEIMGQILTELQTNDPDTFDIIASAYQQRMNLMQMQQNNPVIKGFENKINQLESQLNSKSVESQQAQNQEIVKQWEDGLSEVQKTFGAKLRRLGVKPNWEKVKSSWSSDSTGNISVKDAFFAIHGDQITKALEAQSKLQATKVKSQQRLGPNNNLSNQTAQKPSIGNSGTYLNKLEEIAKKYT